MDIIPSTSPKSLTSDTTFSNCLLNIYDSSKTPKLYCMDKITTEEVIDILDISNPYLEKIYGFGWWDLEIISADAGIQFISTEFKEEWQTCGVHLNLVDPEHQ